MDVPKDKKAEYRQKGLLILGHNHPWNESPLGSAKDIWTYIIYSSRIGFSFNGNGLFLVLNKNYKSNKYKENEIKKTVADIVNDMMDDFYETFEDKTELKSLMKKETEYTKRLHGYVIENHDKYVNQYKQNLKKYGIKIIFINFKKYR